MKYVGFCAQLVLFVSFLTPRIHAQDLDSLFSSYYSYSAPGEVLAVKRALESLEIAPGPCEYSAAIIEAAFPNSDMIAGWGDIGSGDAYYANQYLEAGDIVQQAFEIQFMNNCVDNNKKCCKTGAIEKCIDDPIKNCEMDNQNQWCKNGSHPCNTPDEGFDVRLDFY